MGIVNLDTLPLNQGTSYAYHQSFYTGSGGEFAPSFSTVFSGDSRPAIIEEQVNQKVSEIIDYISSCFSLTKEELKKVCKIQSRKTIYNWADGTSTPRTLTMTRLYELLMIATAWKQSGFAKERTHLLQPILANSSVIDLLQEQILNREQILFAGTRLSLALSSNTFLRDPFTK